MTHVSSGEDPTLSLLPVLPFEFLVRGTAVSLQSSPSSRAAWKRSVRAAARAALPEGAWLLPSRLAVTIYIFPGRVMPGDVDNRVKPILDAMSACVYADDELVERLVVQKFEPGAMFPFPRPSRTLQRAMEADGPVVFIRISDDPHEELSR